VVCISLIGGSDVAISEMYKVYHAVLRPWRGSPSSELARHGFCKVRGCGGALLGGAGSWLRLRRPLERMVRVEVTVRSMVSVATLLLLRTMVDTSVPLRNILMPRLRSACGPAIVAPKSA
jgi:hypothetical protein